MFLKPTHIFHGLVATPQDLIKNWQHRLRMWALRLGLSEPGKYLPSLDIGGSKAFWATAGDGHKIVCVYCKHAVARITLPDGWTVETCSAQGLYGILNSPHTAEWVKQLHLLHEPSEPEINTNTGDLQRTQ